MADTQLQPPPAEPTARAAGRAGDETTQPPAGEVTPGNADDSGEARTKWSAGTVPLGQTIFLPPPALPEDAPTSAAAAHPADPGGRYAPTLPEGPAAESRNAALAATFDRLVGSDAVNWQIAYQLIKAIGSGGQGRVFLADRVGSYGSHFRVALKFFQPGNYPGAIEYHLDMARMTRVAMQIARLQHDSVLDVVNVVDIEGVQVLVMEWVDGLDLRQLLDAHTLDRTQQQVPDWRFEYLNDVVVTRDEPEDDSGIDLLSSRLQPGVAVAITRECLSGLGALHRAGIVHADVKPANIMVKRTGSCKLIDVGSSFTLDDPPRRASWTPRYAAVEVLAGEPPSPASDLASLGYTLVEMLCGHLPWDEQTSLSELIEIKRYLPGQLDELLPRPCVEDQVFVQFVRRLIAATPDDRFANAEAADFDDDGAAGFHRRLVKGDLDSEYRNELRLWLTELDHRT